MIIITVKRKIIIWDFDIHTDHLISARRPDIIIFRSGIVLFTLKDRRAFCYVCQSNLPVAIHLTENLKKGENETKQEKKKEKTLKKRTEIEKNKKEMKNKTKQQKSKRIILFVVLWHLGYSMQKPFWLKDNHCTFYTIAGGTIYQPLRSGRI